jgi:GNAT superfamily N-acetyltransferase
LLVHALAPHARQGSKAQKWEERTLQASVTDGVPIGLLAYLEGVPIAWCSVAPKTAFRLLDEGRAVETDEIWSITCFFVLRPFRGQGLVERLIAAAAAYAKAEGAKVIEAYPVDEDSPSYRFMGQVEQFKQVGFKPVGAAGKRRRVMQRRLD